MTKRKVSNPLALAVLACLWERPMHPYEMASTLRERGKDQSIKLNYGSLYTVVEGLQQHGLIVSGTLADLTEWAALLRARDERENDEALRQEEAQKHKAHEEGEG